MNSASLKPNKILSVKNVSSNKDCCTNLIGLGVRAWLDLFYKQHFMNWAFKLLLALSQKSKIGPFWGYLIAHELPQDVYNR